MTKKILVVPVDKKVEGLRMAAGLTLLDDRVRIGVWGELPTGAETDEQIEALEFSEVPIEQLGTDVDRLAREIVDSEVVYFV